MKINEKRVAMGEPPAKGLVKSKDMRGYLNQRGWFYHDGGAFGRVYRNPKQPQHVLKIFQDPSYLRFLSFTKKSENPHFPNTSKPFYLKFGDLSYWGVMMEFLSDNDDEVNTYVNYFKMISNWKPQRDRNRVPLWMKRIEQEFPRWRIACMEIYELIRKTRRAGGHMETDVEWGRNIMFRGGVPVFTDPVWGGDQ